MDNLTRRSALSAIAAGSMVPVAMSAAANPALAGAPPLSDPVIVAFERWCGSVRVCDQAHSRLDEAAAASSGAQTIGSPSLDGLAALLEAADVAEQRAFDALLATRATIIGGAALKFRLARDLAGSSSGPRLLALLESGLADLEGLEAKVSLSAAKGSLSISGSVDTRAFSRV